MRKDPQRNLIFIFLCCLVLVPCCRFAFDMLHRRDFIIKIGNCENRIGMLLFMSNSDSPQHKFGDFRAVFAHPWSMIISRLIGIIFFFDSSFVETMSSATLVC